MTGGAQSNPDIELATALDPARRRIFTDVASHLIPAAHGMPAAGDVVDERRLAFVMRARPGRSSHRLGRG